MPCVGGEGTPALQITVIVEATEFWASRNISPGLTWVTMRSEI